MKILFLILLLTTFGFAQDGNDFGLWNDVNVSTAINKRVDVFVGAKIETRSDNTRMQEQRYYAGVNVKQRNWTVQGSYIAVEIGSKYWEKRPVLAVSRKFIPAEGWSITPRFRTEYRIRPGKNDFRFVPTVTIDKKLNAKYKVYHTFEFYLDKRKHDSSQYRKRFFFGVNRTINKNLSVDLFYLYQKDEKVNPFHVHRLGANWKVRL